MKKTILLALCLSLAGCPKIAPAGQAAVDCLGEKKTQIEQLITQFVPVVTGGNANWDSIYNGLKQNGLDVAGCVVAELVNYYFASGFRAAPDAPAANAVLDRARKDNGGASFNATCKREDGSVTECKL